MLQDEYNMIKAIIIDDEPLAIEALETILHKTFKEDLKVVATCNSSMSCMFLIEKYQPDLLFFNIEMSGLSGFDLVSSFSNPNFRVIFIAAFNQYAIDAFRLSGINYLLKPVEVDEIKRVIQKIKNEIKRNENLIGLQIQRLEQMMLKNKSTFESRISIPMADKIIFLKTCEILYCEANGVYTTIHLTNGNKMLVSKPLGNIEIQLSSYKFFRIHHSTIINLSHVKEFLRFDGGYVVMIDKTKLKVSHGKKKEFLEVINASI